MPSSIVPPDSNPLKRAVIKEELVAITGDYVSALILNQMIYWTRRRKDSDDYIKEEQERQRLAGREHIDFPLAAGWIYKKADELSKELMLGVSPQTIRRSLSHLVTMGFLQERRNPNHSWDRTLQYRVSIEYVQRVLEEKGFPLDDYMLIPRNSKNNSRSSKLDVQESNLEEQYQRLHTETTTEITTDTSSPGGEEILSPAQLERKKHGEEKKLLHAAYAEILKDLGIVSTAKHDGEVNSAVAKLHKEGCTPKELKAIYTYFKMEKGWNDRHLSLQTVAKNLAAWRAGGSPESSYKPKRKRVFKEYTPEQEALDRAEAKRLLGEDYEPGIFPKGFTWSTSTEGVKDEYF